MTANEGWSGTTSPGELSTTTGLSSTESFAEPTVMKIVYFGNELPHDDLRDLFRRLLNLSKDRQHRLLAAFIHEATVAVKDEVRQLPSAIRSQFPPLETIFDLANYDELRTGPLGGAVEAVLLCAVQLATFIG